MDFSRKISSFSWRKIFRRVDARATRSLQTWPRPFTAWRSLSKRICNDETCAINKNPERTIIKNILWQLFTHGQKHGWKALRYGGQMASTMAFRSKAPGSSPAGVIMLCSWARHLTLSVPLFTQGYKEVPENLMLETQGQLMAIRVYQPNRCEIYKTKMKRTLCINTNPQTSSMSIYVACFSPKFSDQTEAGKPLDSWTCSVRLIASGALSFFVSTKPPELISCPNISSQ